MPDIREFDEMWAEYATANFGFPDPECDDYIHTDGTRWFREAEIRGQWKWRREEQLRRDGWADPGADPAGNWDVPDKQSDYELQTTPTVLAEAETIIHGSRQDDYGNAERNQSRIATMWSAYLDVDITPRQVCMMMVLLKVSRDAHKPKRDNLVDLAGYAALADDVGS
jgi:hypothetical protein